MFLNSLVDLYTTWLFIIIKLLTVGIVAIGFPAYSPQYDPQLPHLSGKDRSNRGTD